MGGHAEPPAAPAATAEFNATQACRLVGCDRDVLERWAAMGLVTPSDAAAAYGYRDLVVLRLAIRLDRLGLRADDVARVVRDATSQTTRDRRAVTVVVRAGGADVCTDEQQLLLALRGVEPAIVVPVAAAETEFAAAVASFQTEREAFIERLWADGDEDLETG